MLDSSCFIVENHPEKRTTKYPHSPFYSRDGRDIDESVRWVSVRYCEDRTCVYLPAVVELALLGTASRRFFLLLLFNLWCLRLDLAGTRKGSVNWVE